MERDRRILNRYAGLLSYPGAGIEEEYQRCRDLLANVLPQAAEDLIPLENFLKEEGRGRLEELYTATFDLRPSCSPYVAVHLCGESRARTLFLVKLKEIYRETGFAGEEDLPDHLGILLRFVARDPEEEGRREIVLDGILPALERMTAFFAEDPGNPYGALLRSLQMYLKEGFSGAETAADFQEVTA